MRAVAVIPARYASTRFPGKPLARDTGRFLIQHVHEAVRSASAIDRTIVATDDHRIVAAVESFGGEVVMTSAAHATGTDRVAQVARDVECDVIVNVQGDEPEIEPAALDTLVTALSRRERQMATLACPFRAVRGGDPDDPHAVKVVADRRGRALYFSRARIPFARAAPEWAGVEPLLHLGTYAYRRPVLLELAGLEPTALERTEGLEQLRALEHGVSIWVEIVERAAVGIDTPDEYAAFVSRWRNQPARGPSEGAET